MTDTNRYYDKYKRDKNSRAFYKSKEWQDVRELALKRDNYLCQRCLKDKKLKKADLVHHIVPLKDDATLRSKLSNLESICHKCHNIEHKVIDNNKVKSNIKANVFVTKTNKEVEI